MNRVDVELGVPVEAPGPAPGGAGPAYPILPTGEVNWRCTSALAPAPALVDATFAR